MGSTEGKRALGKKPSVSYMAYHKATEINIPKDRWGETFNMEGTLI